MDITKDIKGKLIEALSFAKKAHTGQRRKYTDEPYVNHPIRVFNILYGNLPYEEFTSEMQIAALLHDVVEDTTYTLKDIELKFGSKVALLVEGLTDQATKEDGNREVRKEIDRKRIALTSAEVHTIKCADMIDNLPGIIEHDADFAKTYVKEKRELLKVLTGANFNLWKKVEDILNKYDEEHHE